MSMNAVEEQARIAHMRHLVENLRHLEARIRAGGGAERVAKQHKAGKMTARERIAGLVDGKRTSKYRVAESA